MDQSERLLRDALSALNQIRNTRLKGEHKDSYALAAAIEQHLRVEFGGAYGYEIIQRANEALHRYPSQEHH